MRSRGVVCIPLYTFRCSAIKLRVAGRGDEHNYLISDTATDSSTHLSLRLARR